MPSRQAGVSELSLKKSTTKLATLEHWVVTCDKI
jgi:hypothetical protein